MTPRDEELVGFDLDFSELEAAAHAGALEDLLERNARMLEENPAHAYRVELGVGLAELAIRCEWFPGNHTTLAWTDNTAPLPIADEWIDLLAAEGADPYAAALVIAAAVIDPRFAAWEMPGPIDPSLEEEEA